MEPIQNIQDIADMHLTVVANPAAKYWSCIITGKSIRAHTVAAYYEDATLEYDLLARGVLAAIRSLDPARCADVREYMGQSKYRVRILATKSAFVNQILRYLGGLTVGGISQPILDALDEEIALRKIALDPVYVHGVSKKVRLALGFGRQLMYDPNPQMRATTYVIPENVLAEDDSLLVTADAAQSAAQYAAG